MRMVLSAFSIFLVSSVKSCSSLTLLSNVSTAASPCSPKTSSVNRYAVLRDIAQNPFHAVARLDADRHRDRQEAQIETGDLLLLAVVVEREVALGHVVNIDALRSAHRQRNRNLVDVFHEDGRLIGFEQRFRVESAAVVLSRQRQAQRREKRQAHQMNTTASGRIGFYTTVSRSPLKIRGAIPVCGNRRFCRRSSRSGANRGFRFPCPEPCTCHRRSAPPRKQPSAPPSRRRSGRLSPRRR